ncbi:uncharacterized protein LOC102678344 [Apis dorsata]|uniref:uncharacterized protein LOC102678344 n=1 Tax=Apis dorsata TaxID=7462 RepID=UPI0003DF78CE|nr:uncharacterized protein LOC102678344 [Apis dorsata]
MMGVLRWRHDLRSDAGQQQQQRPNTERSSTGHSNHAHAHTHTLPKLISQVREDWLSFRSNPIRVFIVDRCRFMKGKYRTAYWLPFHFMNGTYVHERKLFQ